MFLILHLFLGYGFYSDLTNILMLRLQNLWVIFLLWGSIQGAIGEQITKSVNCPPALAFRGGYNIQRNLVIGNIKIYVLFMKKIPPYPQIL